MIGHESYSGVSIDFVRTDAEWVCYILLPEGLKDDGMKWMDQVAAGHSCSIVVMSGMDWNDDLTPWEAEGVFKKAKPFAGHAEMFMERLCGDIIPHIESRLGLQMPMRFLAGVSLSGLFAVWSVFRCDLFAGIASISGSLWYDGFASWTEGQTPSGRIGKVFVSLGDREKESKDRRMAKVEEMTLQVVEILRRKGACVEFELEENTTHFSPVVPRLEKMLGSLESIKQK